MSISCIVQENNEALDRLAKGLNKSKSLTSIYISKWQTKNRTVDYPTVEELKEFYKEDKNKKNLKLNQNSDYARLNMTYNPVMRHDRATQIAQVFSEVLNIVVDETLDNLNTQISEAKNQEEKDALLGKRLLYTGENGRKEVLKDYGMARMIDRVKQEFQSYLEIPEAEYDADFGEGQGKYHHNEYQKLLDNFSALFDEACIVIEAEEDIRIVTSFDDNKNLRGEITETTNTEDKDDEGLEDDDMERASGNDGWGFEVRMVDPYSTLSKDVKRVLAHIVKYNNNGEQDVDDLGNVRYLNPEYTHACLITELSSMITPDDFNRDRVYPALENMTIKYPWVRQIISALEMNDNLKGSFYSDLRNDLMNYYGEITDKEDYRLKTKSLNTIPAAQSTLTAIQNNYFERNILDKDSIYTKAGKIDASKAPVGIKLTDSLVLKLRDVDSDNIEDVKNSLNKALRMVGVSVDTNMLTRMLDTPEGIDALTQVNTALKSIFSSLNDIDADTDLLTQFKEEYDIISDKLAILGEFDTVLSFRNGDKTMYSASKPNYIDTMIKSFRDDNRKEAYIKEEFKDYDWFFNKKNGKWWSEWLRILDSNDPTDASIRKHMATRELINIDGHEYTRWTPFEIKTAFINEYFSEPYNAKSTNYAWYNMPIFSDSPVVKFIRFVRYTGDFKEQLIPKFRNVVMQELYRINLVNQRNANQAASIQNFDKQGKKFCFFPELNEGTFLQEALSLIDKKDAAALYSMIDARIGEVIDNLFNEFYNNLSQLELEAIKQNVVNKGENVKDKLEEYFWNQAYATTQIIELTTTDLAFYKDEVDFQKRYKEVYASGTKLNTKTKYGKESRRTLYIADQIITSPSYNEIKYSLDKALAEKRITELDRDNILNKFRDINVADAQAYVSPKAMRSILDMMGKWTDEMEATYERFERGEWDMADFNTIWQTIKPFVFTQLRKPDGLGGIMKVPHQNKNSEYLLLAAYDLIANVTGQSPKLRAIQKYMEDNNIDAIQFQSAVKAGGQGIVNINYSESKLAELLTQDVLNTAQKALKDKFEDASDIEKFKAAYDYMLDRGNITQTRYNEVMQSVEPDEDQVYTTLDAYTKENGEFKPEVLHTISYNDYMIQQPVPEHLIDTKGVFGSQLRNLILADMSDNISFNINGKTLKKQQIIDYYNACIVENLLENFKEVKDKVTDIHKLQEVLLSQVKSNSKYGRDIMNALEIVEVINPFTGEKEEAFNIPFSNPTITLELQKLLTSLFKNNITKQYIKGGNAVQVSNYGLTDKLKIRYDNNHNLIGFECFLPATSKDFFNHFMVTRRDMKGNEYQVLNVNALKKAGLDKAVGFRIPTEDKYSMAPLIIKGFLPQQNGSCIMLPAEITQIAGSDFDIDKMFIMLPEFKVSKYDYKRAISDYRKIMSDEATANLVSAIFQGNPNLDASLDETPEDFKEWWKDNKENYELDEAVVEKVKFNTNKKVEENNRAQRNNMLIDIIYNVLVHPSTADKLFNPGNFDSVKVQADISQIINSENLLNAFKDRYGLQTRQSTVDKILALSKDNNLDELEAFMKDYKKTHNTTKSQLTLDTFIYNHQQNMTGGGLIGVYANNTSMQAKYQYSKLALADDYSFKLNGREIKSLHDVVSQLGERISKNCAQFSAASVDNVKYPALDKLMQNMNTAKVAGFMLRAGFSIEEIALFFSQPMVRECIQETNGLDELGERLDKAKDQLDKGGGAIEYAKVPDMDSKLLLNNILVQYDFKELSDYDKLKARAYQLAAARMMEGISLFASYLSEITQVSRADSPNGGILNTIGGAEVQLAKVDELDRKRIMGQTPFTGTEDIIHNEVVSMNMSEDKIREKLLNNPLSKLQAFHSLGIDLGVAALTKFFPQINKISDSIVKEAIRNLNPGDLLRTQYVTDLFNNIYKDLVNFALSDTNIFGDEEIIDNTNIQNKTEIFDTSKAEFYSGAADGADTEWANQARALAIKVKDYTVQDWDNLSQERKDKLDKEYQEVANILGRKVLFKDSYSGKLVRRDMMQADKADAIFAIGSVVKPGQKGKKYVNISNHDVVDGGTGYATQRGIQRGIPVYVFDQSDNQWKVWNDSTKSFIVISEPTLTPHAATIGTRDINGAGKQAIKSILVKTVNNITTQQSNKKPATFFEKRKYYLEQFPKDYVALKTSNPEIAKIGVIKKITMKDNKLEFANSRGLRKESRETFMRDMDNLLYMNDTTRKLAEDLFMYSYYKEGLWFGPNNFGVFFSSNFISQFPEVIDALRYLNVNMNDERFEKNFLDQFYQNNHRYPNNAPRLYWEKGMYVKDNIYYIPSNYVKDKRYTDKTFKFIKVKPNRMDLPITLELINSDTEYATYKVYKGYDTSYGKVYNINTEYNDLAELSKIELPEITEVTEDSMPDNIESVSMQEGIINSFEENANFDMGNFDISSIDRYETESGQNELKDRLC